MPCQEVFGGEISLNMNVYDPQNYSYSLEVVGVAVKSGSGTLTNTNPNSWVTTFVTLPINNFSTFRVNFWNESLTRLKDQRCIGEDIVPRARLIPGCSPLTNLGDAEDINLKIEPSVPGIAFYDSRTEENLGQDIQIKINECTSYRIRLTQEYRNAEEDSITLIANIDGVETISKFVIPETLFSLSPSYPENIVKGENLKLLIYTLSSSCTDLPLPAETKCIIEVVSGKDLVSLKNIETGEIGDTLLDVSHNGRWAELDLIADGDLLTNDKWIWIKAYTTDPQIEPYLFQIEYLGSGIKVTFLPEKIAPGDTADVTLKKINIDGTLEDFAPDQLFDIEIREGFDYGMFFVPEWNDFTQYPYGIMQGIKYIANEDLPDSTLEVKIRVKTSSGGIAVSKIPGREIKKEIPKQIIKNYQSVASFNTTMNDEALWGFGELVIGEGGDCSDAPQCDEPINSMINFAQIDTSICNENNDADGITKFYINKFVKEFNLNACYSQSLDKWQFQIITPLKYSTELCYKPDRIYLADTNQIKAIPFNDLCKAQEDFAGFENTQNTKYKILDIIKRHEYLHVEQNINILNDALAETQFYRKLSSLTLSCNEINNQQKAADFALNQFKKDLVATTMEIYRLKKREIEGNPYSQNINEVKIWIDNEEKINGDLEIKSLSLKYLAIAERINKCIN